MNIRTVAILILVVLLQGAAFGQTANPEDLVREFHALSSALQGETKGPGQDEAVARLNHVISLLKDNSTSLRGFERVQAEEVTRILEKVAFALATENDPEFAASLFQKAERQWKTLSWSRGAAELKPPSRR